MNLLWFALGALWGVLGTLALRWSVARVQPESPGRALPLVVGGSLLRLGLVALLLLAALRQGIVPALLLLVGMLLTRSILLLVWRGPSTWSGRREPQSVASTPAEGYAASGGTAASSEAMPSWGEEDAVTEPGRAEHVKQAAFPPSQNGAAAGLGL